MQLIPLLHRARRAGQVKHVNGTGVIGKYPVLREGGYRDDMQGRSEKVRPGQECEGEFVYQSCSGSLSGEVAQQWMRTSHMQLASRGGLTATLVWHYVHAGRRK